MYSNILYGVGTIKPNCARPCSTGRQTERVRGREAESREAERQTETDRQTE